MKIIIGLFIVFLTLVPAESILVLNSNAKVTRYATMQKSFTKHINVNVKYFDISNMSDKQVKEYLYDVYPDIVYAIGTKAYQYASKYIPEKKIFFSSIVNYKRLQMGSNTFGVANELHTGMQLTLIKSLLNHTKSISMVYSEYTKDVYKRFKEEAKNIDIKVIGQKLDIHTKCDMNKLQQADVFMLIADPIIIKDENKVKTLFSKMKTANKPVIAYHPLYIKFGAVLILSVDVETIGKQVAFMMHSDIDESLSQPIQSPIGTKVIFNEGLVKRMGLKYNKSALGVANKVIR